MKIISLDRLSTNLKMNYLDIKNIEHDLASQIKTWAKEFGFSSVGITDINLSDDQRYLDKWLEAIKEK